MTESRLLLFRRDHLDTRFASQRWRESREPLPLGQLVDELRREDRHRCDRIVLAGGAPLDHPQFDALLDEAARLGFANLSLETEAAPLADRALLDSLMARGIDRFVIHVGGLTAAMHERMLMVPPGSFERSLAGLRNLADARGAFQAVIPLTRLNVDEVAPLAARLIELGGWSCKGVRLSPAEFSRLPPAAHGEVLSRREVARAALPVFRLCRDNQLETGFTNAGSLLPCASFEELDGFESPFVEWQQAIAHPRKGETWQRFDGCASCSLAERCPGVERNELERFGTAHLTPVPAAVRSRWTRKPPPRLDPAPLLPDYRRDGYVTLRGVVPPPLLAGLQAAFDRLMAPIVAAEPDLLLHSAKNIVQKDPIFLELIDLPGFYPLMRAIIGKDITLAHGGVAYYKRPRSPAYLSWHNDFNWLVDVPYPRPDWFWVRCLVFIDDIDEDTAPMAILPGTQKSTHACPSSLTREDGQPVEAPGMVRLTGKAGDCVVFNTEVWHTNTDNRGDRIRKLVMLTYKHAWLRQWTDDQDIKPDFAEAQRDPLRWQLCGGGIWHRQNGVWQA